MSTSQKTALKIVFGAMTFGKPGNLCLLLRVLMGSQIADNILLKTHSEHVFTLQKVQPRS